MAERVEIMKKTNGCHLCLSINHIGKPCPWISKWGACKLGGCQKYHSRLLHEAEEQGLLSNLPRNETSCSLNIDNGTLLLVQVIPTVTDGELVAFFDNGSTVSLVSKQFVQRRKWEGIPVTYDLITVGGDRKTQSTYLHEIQLLDSNGKEHVIKAF